MIFLELLKLYLLTGKIFLNYMGNLWQDHAGFTLAYSKIHDDADKYAKPDVSIFRALNKYWTERAKHLLYSYNTFVLPPTDIINDSKRIFQDWDPRVLRLVKLFEVRLAISDSLDFLQCARLFPLWRKWIIHTWTMTFKGLRDVRPHHLLIDCRISFPEDRFFFADKLNFSKIPKMVSPKVIEVLADCSKHKERLLQRIQSGARSNGSYIIEKGSPETSTAPATDFSEL